MVHLHFRAGLATAFDNFFGVRWHPDAQPEIQELARQMFSALQSGTPRAREPDQWHLPFVSADEEQALGLDTARRCSAARCARVSYLNHDGTAPNVAKDLDTFAKLAGDPNGPPRPLHASPMEHQATPDRLRTPTIPNRGRIPRSTATSAAGGSIARCWPESTSRDSTRRVEQRNNGILERWNSDPSRWFPTIPYIPTFQLIHSLFPLSSPLLLP
jgi:hypothetical protein